MKAEFLEFVSTTGTSELNEEIERAYGAPCHVVFLAIACHELNKVICDLAGDHSQVPWEDAESWQVDSALEGVRFALENPNATPKDQHDSWSAKKIADGWVYGPEKCFQRKTHPCLVPYEDLPWIQKLKDMVFQTVVRASQ